VNLFPCTLVYVDVDASPGPNSTNRDPLAYVSQAICLNNSLRRAGMPKLTIMTNAPAVVAQRLEGMAKEHRPALMTLKATIELPKNTPFYAAHFKLDLMDQMADSLPADTMLLLLDADMVALLPLERNLIERCAEAGLGAFDISDQVFPPYGSDRVVADLEIVADRRLRNPRWYGGEFLLATPAALRRLVPRARASYARYVTEIGRLRHHGDEAFISAALNVLVDEGQGLIEWVLIRPSAVIGPATIIATCAGFAAVRSFTCQAVRRCWNARRVFLNSHRTVSGARCAWRICAAVCVTR
jgi:hypothetical protein